MDCTRDVYTSAAGPQHLQVWRPACHQGTARLDCQDWTLMCENDIPATSPQGGDEHYELPEADHCYVQVGDVVGWYSSGTDTISFDNNCAADAATGASAAECDGHVLWHTGPHPGLHGALHFESKGNRLYSIRASVKYCVNCALTLPFDSAAAATVPPPPPTCGASGNLFGQVRRPHRRRASSRPFSRCPHRNARASPASSGAGLTPSLARSPCPAATAWTRRASASSATRSSTAGPRTATSTPPTSTSTRCAPHP
jgi:hypothetical protein